MEGSPGVSAIEGVLGRECKTCDRAQISSSRQVSGEMETCFEFFMASKNAAPEHCKKLQCGRLFSGVRAFGRQFKAQRAKNCELECENGSKRDWSEETTVDGNGTVVEIGTGRVTDGSRNAT